MTSEEKVKILINALQQVRDNMKHSSTCLYYMDGIERECNCGVGNLKYYIDKQLNKILEV